MLLNIKQAIPIFLAALLFVAFLLLALFAPDGSGFWHKQAPWGLLTCLSMIVAACATLAAVHLTCNSIINKGETIQTQIDRIINRNPLRL